MALDLPGLTSDLETLFASAYESEADAAEAWRKAIRDFTTAIVPAVSGPVQDGAAAVFEAALVGFSSPNTASAIFTSAFAAYATALAAGMPGAPPAVPPAVPLSTTLGPILAVTYLSHTTAASAIASTIYAWFLTGVSPSGSGTWT